jgi:gluconolactonase
MKILQRGIRHAALVGMALAIVGCSSSQPPWTARNQAVIDAHQITGRSRELPDVTVPMALVDGEPVLAADLPTAAIATGVEAQLAWGRGALLERVTMQAGAEYPAQTLDEEVIIIVTAGSASVEFDGKTVELAKDNVLYLTPGSTRTMRAGADGWQAYEVYSPVRLDHLALAGQDISDADVGFADQGVTPSLEPGVVFNLNQIQWTPLTDPAADLGYRRSSAMARVIWGRNAQVSFVRMDPDSTTARHIHPEDQLSVTLRGTVEQGVMDGSFSATGTAGQVVPPEWVEALAAPEAAQRQRSRRTSTAGTARGPAALAAHAVMAARAVTRLSRLKS